jgi:hypothetical protein
MSSRLSSGTSTNAVSVYPNPASNVINIMAAEDATIQLMDAQGRLVMAESKIYANQKQEFNTQNFANGVYTLKVFNDHFVSSSKVIIQK